MKTKLFAFTLVTLVTASQLVSLPSPSSNSSALQESRQAQETPTYQHLYKLYHIEKDLFAYNKNSAEYVPTWVENENTRNSLINTITSFINDGNYNNLDADSSYNEYPILFLYRSTPNSQQAIFIRQSKKHFLGLMLFTGIINHLPENTQRFIFNELDHLSQDLQMQLLSEYLLIFYSTDIFREHCIPKKAASLYFKKHQSLCFIEETSSNMILTYLESENYQNLVKCEKVPLLTNIFKSEIWKINDALKSKLLSIISSHVPWLLHLIKTLNPAEGFRGPIDETTTSLTILDNKTEDSHLIMAILKSKFWRNDEILTQQLCQLFIEISQRGPDQGRDDLIPILKSGLWQKSKDLARQCCTCIIQSLDPSLSLSPCADAKVILTTLKSGIWQTSNEVKTQIMTVCPQVFEKIWEESDENRVEQYIEPLLHSILESKIWQENTVIKDFYNQWRETCGLEAKLPVLEKRKS